MAGVIPVPGPNHRVSFGFPVPRLIPIPKPGVSGDPCTPNLSYEFPWCPGSFLIQSHPRATRWWSMRRTRRRRQPWRGSTGRSSWGSQSALTGASSGAPPRASGGEGIPGNSRSWEWEGPVGAVEPLARAVGAFHAPLCGWQG